jgi:hypothetical protein
VNGLLDRIAARRCRFQTCNESRANDALLCAVHLTDLWMRRLDREGDGSFVMRRTFRAVDLTERRAA